MIKKLIILLIGSVMVRSKESVQVNYDKFQVWQLTPKNNKQFDYLQDLLALEEDGGQIQFWTPPTMIGNPSKLIIGPDNITEIEQTVRKLKFSVRKEVQNLEDQILQEKVISKLYDYRSQVPSFSLDEYHRYDEIQDFMKDLQKLHPEFVEVESIGITSGGRSIDLIKIGNFEANITKPTFWLDAGIHAREWIAPATALYIIDQVVKTYSTSKPMGSDVVSVNWMILPVVNPDGYEYSHTNDRMWRKNRGKCRPEKKQSRCCYGVDLNRNWDFHWKTSGVSSRPCASNYPGESAFSELETKAMSKYMVKHKDSIKSVLTMHSYGQYLMYPYGHQRRAYPKNIQSLKEIADRTVAAIKKNSGQIYRTGTSADALYPASGCSDDWAKSIGIDIVYVVELSPSRGSFVLKPKYIKPTGDDIWKAIQVIIQYITPGSDLLTHADATVTGQDITCEDLSKRCRKYSPSSSSCTRISTRKKCPRKCKAC